MINFPEHKDLFLKTNVAFRRKKNGIEFVVPQGTTIEFNRETHHDQIFWLRRLEESATDNCVEVVKPPKKK